MASEYSRKHFTTEEPEFSIQCPNCDSIFCADWRWFTYRIDDSGTFAEISCPYCHKRFRSAV